MGWLVGLSPGPFGDGAHHPDHAPHLACGSVRCSGGCRDSSCCPQEATSPGKLGQQQHSQDLLHLSAKNKPKQRTREGSGEEKMAFSGSQVLAKVLHATPPLLFLTNLKENFSPCTFSSFCSFSSLGALPEALLGLGPLVQCGQAD